MGMVMKKIFLIILISYIFPACVFGQYSSYAEPDFITSIDYCTQPAKSWRFGFTYNHKNLSKLVTNSNLSDDETRTRLTHGFTTRIVYGISDKLALGLSINYVKKNIELRLPTIGREYLRMQGLSDTYLISEYTPLKWCFPEGKKLSFGTALKIPTGKTSYTSEEILVREDMQAGTGSYDFLIWASTLWRLSTLSPGYLYLESGYRLNGTGQDISYGDEVFASAGLLLLPEYEGRFTGYVRYSHVGKNRNTYDNIIPNSGGGMITMVGDIKADLSENVLGRLTLEAPVSNTVEGTQLAAKYIITLSFQYTFRGIKDNGH